jgi:hypothetical protein
MGWKKPTLTIVRHLRHGDTSADRMPDIRHCPRTQQQSRTVSFSPRPLPTSRQPQTAAGGASTRPQSASLLPGCVQIRTDPHRGLKVHVTMGHAPHQGTSGGRARAFSEISGRAEIQPPGAMTAR